MPQGVAARIELKPAQKRALDALVDGRRDELTRSAYQELTGMSRSQAAYDLADLVADGVLTRIGSGRATRYRLAQQPSPAQRRWTSERIRHELGRFCDGREAWPSAQEFKAEGHWDLYVAASRYGGIGFWSAELGFPRERPAPPPAPAPRRRVRWTLSWTSAGAGIGAVAVAAVVAVVWPNERAHRTAQTPRTRVIVKHDIVPRRSRPTRSTKASRASHRAARQTRSQPPTQSAPRATAQPSAQTAVLASRRVAPPPAPPAPPAASAPTHREPASATSKSNSSPSSSGPTPLAAPPSSGNPPPLPPP